MRPRIRETAPELLKAFGVGFDVAAKLLIAAGDNPHRIRSEAAWAHLCGGRTDRRVVRKEPTASFESWREPAGELGDLPIMTVRMAHDQATRDYIVRRTAEGKTMGEIARMLKRYMAREVYKTLPTAIS